MSNNSKSFINTDGFDHFFTWNKSKKLLDLYLKRVRQEFPEMECAAQAAEILKSLSKPGDSILDVACGTGYAYHSIKKRCPEIEYFGIDANNEFIKNGNKVLSKHGLNSRLKNLRVEDFRGEFDHILCMNFLSNIENYHKNLERMLLSTKKSLILRESINEKNDYKYVVDKYLDDKNNNLSVYVNTYDIKEFIEFIQSYNFDVKIIKDKRTSGKKEMIIDYPHYWKFILATKKT
tara:strand:- start:54 stop:755 length:702 start_codon:yes stop_codon:yes gene_type:complete